MTLLKPLPLIVNSLPQKQYSGDVEEMLSSEPGGGGGGGPGGSSLLLFLLQLKQARHTTNDTVRNVFIE